ncbi:MAG TPA: hypothetical protein VF933_12305 [Streptosporangiaceae bacterium]
MGAEPVAGTGAVPDGVLLRAGEHGGCLAELAAGWPTAPRSATRYAAMPAQ